MIDVSSAEMGISGIGFVCGVSLVHNGFENIGSGLAVGSLVLAAVRVSNQSTETE